jgi:hypothetical protein
MSKPLTTEQMVRKCFCIDCEFAQDKLVNERYLMPCNTLCGPYIREHQHLARAARRFVRMENEQERNTRCFVVQVAEHDGLIYTPVRFQKLSQAKRYLGKTNGTITERVERLMKFKSACRKTRRAG